MLIKLILSAHQDIQDRQKEHFFNNYASQITYRQEGDALLVDVDESVQTSMAKIYHLHQPLSFSDKLYLVNEMMGLKKLINQRFIEDYEIIYPEDQYQTIESYYDNYFTNFFTFRPFPLTAVAHLFGSENAFYFDFILLITRFLWGLVLFSIIATAASWGYGTVDNVFNLINSIALAMGFIFFISFWNRNVNVRNYQWNGSIENVESIMEPMYTENVLTRTVSTTYLGENALRYTKTNQLKQLLRYLSQLPLYLVIMGFSGLNVWLNEQLMKSMGDIPMAAKEVVASMFSSIVMIGIDYFMYFLIIRCGEMEKHLFYSSYRNSQIIKYTVLNLLNTFSGLVYQIVSAKVLTSDLTAALIVQFILKELVYRKFSQMMEKKHNTTPKLNLQYYISNYQEILSTLIYLLMFAWIFPAGTVLVLFNNYLEIKMDLRSYLKGKLLIPKICYNIGIWKHIIDHAIFVSVSANCLFIVFFSKMYEQFSVEQKLIGFIVFQQIIIFLKGFAAYLIRPVPLQLQMLLRTKIQSQNYLERDNHVSVNTV